MGSGGCSRAAALMGAALVSVLAACTGPTLRARLDDAAGLVEGAPVEVAGVRVGEVKAVRLVESREVEVVFELDRGHELRLHSDACAVAAGGAHPRLLVVVGEDPGEFGEGPIPRCSLPTEALGALGEVVGEGLGRLAEGVLEGFQKSGGAATVDDFLGQLAGASGQGAPAAQCVGLRVSVADTRPVPAAPGLPNGGREITLLFENTSARALRLPAVGNARIESARGAPLVPLQAGADGWRGSFDVPARGQVRVKLVFAGDVRPARLVVRPVTLVDDPLATCVLGVEGL